MVADVDVRWSDAERTVALRFHGDEVGPSAVLDVDDYGWPLASHSLLELSTPARDLLTLPYGDAEAEEAIGLATVAWNLPALDTREALAAPEEFRQSTLDGAERARKLPARWREAFETMVRARTTRFSYGPRVIVSAKARTEDRKRIEVNAASLRLDEAAAGEQAAAEEAD